MATKMHTCGVGMCSSRYFRLVTNDMPADLRKSASRDIFFHPARHLYRGRVQQVGIDGKGWLVEEEMEGGRFGVTGEKFKK